ncbi:MAG: SCP2 sterol-binding domain-containing protein [Gammaproteobacteria bacterium]|nr:SCP2 sterol-binding domain-containing protein [Gammaproteobacteria bacterium]
MVNMLYSAMAGMAEKIINAYISLDPESPVLLEALQGKTLKVYVDDVGLSFLLAPKPSGFSLYINSENAAEVELSGRLLNLVEFAFSAHPQGLVSSGRVKQTGDVGVLQAYQRFMDQSQVDWEGLFAKVIGDAAAFELCKAGKKTQEWQKDNMKSSCLDFTEYLQEEKRLLPAREEVEDFFEDIAKLREDVERLEARLAHIE